MSEQGLRWYPAITLIHDYTLDADVPWTTTPMTSHWLTKTYLHDRVEMAYRRFTLRDAGPAVFTSCFVLGSWLFAAPIGLIHQTPFVSVMMWIDAIGFTVASTILLLLHFFFESTALVTRIRFFVSIFAIGCTVLAIMFEPLYYHFCGPEVVDFFSYFGPRPSRNPLRDCEYVISTYPLTALAFGISVYRLRSWMQVLCLSLTVFFLLIAYTYPQSFVFPSAQLVILGLIYVVTAGVSALISMVREKVTMSQFEQRVALKNSVDEAIRRNEEVDNLLITLLPESALQRLLSGEAEIFDLRVASILFADMVNFTKWSVSRSAKEVVSMLHIVVTYFDDLTHTSGEIEKVKTIGDAYWATCGIPDPVPRHADRLCQFGAAMQLGVIRMNERHPEWGVIQFRIGVHSGSVYAGILGTSRMSYEPFGTNNTIAESVEKAGSPGEVVVTGATVALLVEESVEDATVATVTVGSTTVQCHCLQDLAGAAQRLFRLEAAQGSPIKCDDLTHMTLQDDEVTLVSQRKAFLKDRADRRKRQQARAKIAANQNNQHHQPPTAATMASAGTTRLDNASIATNGTISTRTITVALLTPSPSVNPDTITTKSDSTASTFELNLGDTSPEVMKERLSARKWKWLIMTLEDTHAESQFQKWTEDQTKTGRRIAKISSLVTTVVVALCVLIDQLSTNSAFASTPPPAPWYAVLLILLAVILNMVAVLTSFVSRFHQAPIIDDLLNVLSSGFLIVGASQLPFSIIGNDVTYLIPMSIFPTVSSTMTPYYILVPLQVLFVGLPVYILTFRASPYYFVDVLVATCELIFSVWFTYLNQRHLRHQFTDYTLAKILAQQQVEKNDQQLALLEAVVPVRLIDPMVEWVRGGMDPATTIIREIKSCCIGFLKLNYDEQLPSPKGGHHQQQPQRLTTGEMTLRMDDTGDDEEEEEGVLYLADVIPASNGPRLPRGTSPQQQQQHHHDQRRATSITPTERNLHFHHHRHSSTDAAVENEIPALLEIHREIDDELDCLMYIDKIKTVGDIIMIGGPFDEVTDVRLAGKELMQLLQMFHALPNFQAGVHVGEVVAAVIGTSRLTFDVFGDTVNAASRVMTTSSGGIAISEEFYRVIHESQENSTTTTTTTLLPTPPDQFRDATPPLESETTKSQAPPPSALAKESWAGFPTEPVTFGPPQRCEAKGRDNLFSRSVTFHFNACPEIRLEVEDCTGSVDPPGSPQGGGAVSSPTNSMPSTPSFVGRLGRRDSNRSWNSQDGANGSGGGRRKRPSSRVSILNE